MASRRKGTKPKHEPPPPPKLSRRGVWLRAAIIVLAGAAVYANSLSGPFVLDDQDTIVMNEQIRQLWPPSVVLFPALELPVAGRPAVNVSFALNYALGGLDVRGYHLVNIATHIACALLLFGIVGRTLNLPSLRDRFGTRSTDLAFAASLIWLVHPLLTDAVDYVTQRTELMLGFFYLLTLYTSIRAVRLKPDTTNDDQVRPDTTYDHSDKGWLTLSVIACVLGMASKESMVTAPLMIVVYDRIFVFRTWRETWQRRAVFYVPLAATWMVLAALIWSGPRFRSAGFSSGVSPWIYLLNQAQMIVRYLRLAIWPRGLVVDYGVPRALTLTDAAPHGALVLSLAALTIWALVRAPKIGFLGAWFFTTLSPTSSIVPIATEVGAERRMYLPLAAIVVLGVIGFAWVLERYARQSRPAPFADPTASPPELQRRRANARAHVAGLAALAVVAAALAAGTVLRNREFASAVTLVRTAAERWPTPRAQTSLGVALVAEGRHEEAIAQLQKALADDPNAHYALGVALFQQGKLDEAVTHLRGFLERESLRLEVPVAHELIGRALRTQGKHAEAEQEFRLVLKMTPSNGNVHGLLAETLFRQQKFDEAVGHYRQFLAFRPNDISTLMQLGIAYVNLRRSDDAIVQFRRVVELVPQDAAAQRNLARALLETRAFAEAEPHARQAVRLRPDDAVAHDQLGLALAGQGKLDEAIAELRRSLQIDPNDAEVREHLAAVVEAKGPPARRP
jgi:tetratricopeptide (TPR) repeat protein